MPGFEYNQLAPYFHSFEAASSPLGFEFEDEKIAEELFTKVSSFILKESSLSSKNGNSFFRYHNIVLLNSDLT